MKPSRPFRFKRFEISQERAAMKVTTDGVLLGAWCTIAPQARRALDIGTGTGLIALMMAQRGEEGPLHVDALEPEEGACEDALQNAASSPWAERIRVFRSRLQDFRPADKYDLVVCNPPYFANSLLPPSPRRRAARHDGGLPRGVLVECAGRLCKEGAVFAVVIPREQAGDYIVEGDLNGFSLSRRTDVGTRAQAPAKRTLLEFVFRPAKAPHVQYRELAIETAPLQYTPGYISLTRDFYLKF